ncbi:MAG: choice-of-anchor Q domain-containing protein [Anaerolineales bacterium]
MNAKFQILTIIALLATSFSAKGNFNNRSITGMTSANPANICYVKSNASGKNDGSSWENAFTDLQSALGSSACPEIWVAAGTYKPTSGTDRTASFVLKNGVAVYGGFAGTETDMSQSNINGNPTILSGDIDSNDSENPASNPSKIVGHNSYHVVNAGNVDNTAILDGFIITAGQADGSGVNGQGGGMYISSGSPTLSNLTFSGNTAFDGSGIYNSGGSPNLANITFNGNSNSDLMSMGGGIDSQSGNPLLVNVAFNKNLAAFGGGMFIYQGNPALTDVTFQSNIANGSGENIQMINNIGQHLEGLFDSDIFYFNGSGGGIESLNGGPVLTNVIFKNNVADQFGGGMDIDWGRPALNNVAFVGNSAGSGGGINNYDGNPTLNHVTFNKNQAGQGGGMNEQDQGAGAIIINANFADNHSGGSGGGIYTVGQTSNYANITFSGNSAQEGGGMYSDEWDPVLKNITFSGNTASDDGGGIYLSSSSPTLTNVTISNNSADDSGGGIFTSKSHPKIGHAQIKNSILWNNHTQQQPNQVDGIPGSIALTFSIVQGGCPSQATCANVKSDDPLLGPLGDFGGFSFTIPLLPVSPAIGAGNTADCPTTDQRGVSHPEGSTCDLGAFELGGK